MTFSLNHFVRILGFITSCCQKVVWSAEVGLGGLWYKLEAQVGGESWQEDVEMVRYKVDPVGSWVPRWILGAPGYFVGSLA